MRQLTEMVWLADTVLVAVPDMGHRQTDRQTGSADGARTALAPSVRFVLSLHLIYLFVIVKFEYYIFVPAGGPITGM